MRLKLFVGKRRERSEGSIRSMGKVWPSGIKTLLRRKESEASRYT
jgi:hypothetical protein